MKLSKSIIRPTEWFTISSSDCGLLSTTTCFPLANYGSFPIGQLSPNNSQQFASAAKGVFLSMQSQNVQWRDQQDASKFITALVGAFMNIPRNADGTAAHDVLLWGARGMGKSALVRAAVADVQASDPQALALVQIAPGALPTFPALVAELARLHAASEALGMSTLVEVHDEAELKRALSIGATLVGVNQRDLHSFAVDTTRAVRVAGMIPADVVAVAESGIAGADDARRCADAGYRAVLVGEHLVRAVNPEKAVSELRVPLPS